MNTIPYYVTEQVRLAVAERERRLRFADAAEGLLREIAEAGSDYPRALQDDVAAALRLLEGETT